LKKIGEKFVVLERPEIDNRGNSEKVKQRLRIKIIETLRKLRT